MTWNIPFTFFAGTKAKANEVNSNFTSLKQFIDLLEENTANNELDISVLQSNKADLNGNNTQRFQTADAISSKDAVNKDTLLRYTENSNEVIKGYNLSKFNENTITATAGVCYNSTFEFVIKSNISLSLSDANLGANATYFVFVCGDAEALQTPVLVFSNSSDVPSLPIGYEYYRRIGSFTTDENSQIKDVFTESSSNFVIEQKLEANGYCKLSNGLIIQWGTTGGGSVTYEIPYKIFAIPVCIKKGFGYTKDPDSGIGSFNLTGFSYSCRGAYSGMNWIAVGV